MSAASLFIKKTDTAWRTTWLARWVFIASGVAFAVCQISIDFSRYGMASRGYAWVPLVSVVLAFAAFWLVTCRFSLLEKIFHPVHRSSLVTAGVLLLTAAVVFFRRSLVMLEQLGERMNPDRMSPMVQSIWNSLHGTGRGMSLVTAAIVLSFLPVLFVFLYAFVSRFWEWAQRRIRTSDRIERVYVIAAGGALSAMVVILFSLTTVFYSPDYPGGPPYDILYTSDTGYIVALDLYVNVGSGENDLRHPLLGVFAMPPALCAHAAAMLLFFVPNAYPLLLAIVHVLLMVCGFVLLARVMKVQGGDKILFLLLATALYPTLFFALNLERYVLSVFWILVLVEAYFHGGEDERNKPYFWIAATGTTLTSGAFFPLLAPYGKTNEGTSGELGGRGGMQTVFLRTVSAGVIGVAFLALSGKLPVVFNMKRMAMCVQYTGIEVSFFDRVKQFLEFVSSCFVPPPAHMEWVEGSPRYWSDPATSVSIAGLVLLGLAVAGFVLNFKDRFAQISFGWMGFSFLILCVIGWGTAENGLVLYSFYFSWAYFALIFLLGQKLLARTKPVRYIVYLAAVAVLLAMSIPEICRIVSFGMEYYPVK